MSLPLLNSAPQHTAATYLRKCCSSEEWITRMLRQRPFRDSDAVHAAADSAWIDLGEEDYLEAFRGHPKIGDIQSLKKKYSDSANLARSEQSGVESASPEILQKLSATNHAYEEKFGFIFIVCATGKSASEMLAILQDRLERERAAELKTACEQQRQIFHLRLDSFICQKSAPTS
mgnify:FL=1